MKYDNILLIISSVIILFGTGYLIFRASPENYKCAKPGQDIYDPSISGKGIKNPCCVKDDEPEKIKDKFFCPENYKCAKPGQDIYDPSISGKGIKNPCCVKDDEPEKIKDKFFCPKTEINKTGKVTIGTLNLHTMNFDQGKSWGVRKGILQKVVSNMNCDVICVQESTPKMIEDIFSSSQYRTIANGSGVQKNWDEFQTNLPQINSPGNNFCPSNTTVNNQSSPCCRYGGDDAGPCHYNGNPNYKACQNGDPVDKGISYRILYKKSVKLLNGGRKQFTIQGGCPQWDSQRNYEWAVFSSGGKKFVVYGPHLSQGKNQSSNSEEEEGWGYETNEAQQIQMHDDAINNFNTGELKNIPFIISADLNEKKIDYWQNQSNVNVVANRNPNDVDECLYNHHYCDDKECKTCSNLIDYIISSTDINVIDTNFVSTTINGVEGTDHPYGLTATFQL